ncbi:MAG: trehalase-like domain-containing protein, partial [Bdellovibrionota bacterium]
MDRSAAPAISDHGLIGNCRTAALVSRRGEVSWACFPIFDSPSIFSSILDEHAGGCFSITPLGEFQSQQHYLPRTNVLSTSFSQDGSEARTLDFFPVTSEQEKKVRFWPDHELLRVVEGIRGEVRFRVSFSPRPDFGKRGFQLHRRGKLGISCQDRHTMLLFRSDIPQTEFQIVKGDRAEGEFTVRAG